MGKRFDLDALDPDDPFELDDGNFPHLAKHQPFTADDALDAWSFGDPLFYEAPGGPADWLMIARVPGDVVIVPLAPPKSGDSRKCRPIGIYPASQSVVKRYYADLEIHG